jgi:hypothetical protein
LQQWNCKSPTPLHHCPAAEAFAQLPEQPTNTQSRKSPKNNQFPPNGKQSTTNGKNPQNPKQRCTKTENTDQRWIRTRTRTTAIQKTIIYNFSNTSFTKAVNNFFSCDDKQHVLID